MFDFKTLRSEVFWDMGKDYKEKYPDEHKKLVGIKKAIIDSWVKKPVRFVEHENKKYKVTIEEVK